MKIQNDESFIHLRSVLKSGTDQAPPAKPLDTGKEAVDKVQLSPRAREFNRIKDFLETVPDDSPEKVAALTESVEKGTYKPDAGKAADKLIRESLLDILA